MKPMARAKQVCLSISALLCFGAPIAWGASFEQGTRADMFDAVLDSPQLAQKLNQQQLNSTKATTVAELLKSTRDSVPVPGAKPSIPAGTGGAAQPLIMVQSPLTGNKPKIVPGLPTARALTAEEEEAQALSEARLLREHKVEHSSIAARSSTSDQILNVTIQAGRLVVSATQLELRAPGESISIKFQGMVRDAQIYTRDTKVVRWNTKLKSLTAQQQGQTELYITYLDEMKIVSVKVKDQQKPDPLLASSAESMNLRNLTSVLPLEHKEPLTYRPEQSPVTMPETNDRPRPLTLAGTAAEVDAAKKLTDEAQSRFVYPVLGPEYRKLAIQVMDERSAPEQSLIYPASGLTLRLLGTRVAAKTDARGFALFGDVPTGSRFWVLAEDEKGLYVPTVTELAFEHGDGTEVLRAKTLTYRTYFAYQNVLDLAQDNNLSSFCARAMDARGNKALADMRVSLNVSAEGPFYFGQFGPQRDGKATGTSGRFCFFNVKPGLTELSFYDQAGFRTAVTLPLFPGAHSEEDVLLENASPRTLYLAALPTATEQIYEDVDSNQELLQRVDGAEVIAIGDNQPMTYVSPGVVAHDVMTSFKGRVYALTQSAEFENIVTAVDRDQKIAQQLSVVPMLPRGFAEDLYHELNQQDGHDTIPFDPALGQAVIFHKLARGQGQVKISLVDGSGRLLPEGWYFGNTSGLVKAAFFNLSPGVYQVIVESNQGAIVAMDTLAVDYWTTAFSQTASSLHFAVTQQNHASLSE